jgi:hypothetical protein
MVGTLGQPMYTGRTTLLPVRVASCSDEAVLLFEKTDPVCL